MFVRPACPALRHLSSSTEPVYLFYCQLLSTKGQDSRDHLIWRLYHYYLSFQVKFWQCLEQTVKHHCRPLISALTQMPPAAAWHWPAQLTGGSSSRRKQVTTALMVRPLRTTSLCFAWESLWSKPRSSRSGKLFYIHIKHQTVFKSI